MKQTSPFVITISRQLGSGGAYIGQKLAKKLNIYYADRDIIKKAAEQLSVSVKTLKSWDERAQSIWESFIPYSIYAPENFIPMQLSVGPTSIDLFKTESEIIKRIAYEHSSVIIGRCGFHLLQDHPKHVNIFIYGDSASRSKRLQKFYQISEKSANEMIIQNDKQRAEYIDSFTGKNWTDARLYDLSINTSNIDIDKCVDIIVEFMK